jgi:hypothetical protein
MLTPGHIYLHPEDGPIRVESGDWLVGGRISNWWTWTILASSERRSGYGSRWEDVTDDYLTISIPRTSLGLTSAKG